MYLTSRSSHLRQPKIELFFRSNRGYFSGGEYRMTERLVHALMGLCQTERRDDGTTQDRLLTAPQVKGDITREQKSKIINASQGRLDTKGVSQTDKDQNAASYCAAMPKPWLAKRFRVLMAEVRASILEAEELHNFGDIITAMGRYYAAAQSASCIAIQLCVVCRIGVIRNPPLCQNICSRFLTRTARIRSDKRN